MRPFLPDQIEHQDRVGEQRQLIRQSAGVAAGSAEPPLVVADDLDPETVAGGTPWYADGDSDGFGAGTPTFTCDSQPGGMVADDTDCDDGDDLINPDGTEVCDAGNADEDCDNLTDNNDPSATGETNFYPDGDSDGYGAGAAILACDDTNTTSAVSTDCNDSLANVSPGGTEACDGAITR